MSIEIHAALLNFVKAVQKAVTSGDRDVGLHTLTTLITRPDSTWGQTGKLSIQFGSGYFDHKKCLVWLEDTYDEFDTEEAVAAYMEGRLPKGWKSPMPPLQGGIEDPAGKCPAMSHDLKQCVLSAGHPGGHEFRDYETKAPGKMTCPFCNGLGKVNTRREGETRPCPTCLGTGQIKLPVETKAGVCDVCNGTGQIAGGNCYACGVITPPAE